MRVTITVLATMLLTAPVAFAAAGPGCPMPAGENFELGALTKLIRNEACQVKTIDDVLGLLPESMRSTLALFYKSQSLQGPHKVDYINPRAILSSVLPIGSYDPNPALRSAMMLSFNGHPSQPGYDRLEILNLIPAAGENSFNYHEISFPAESTVATLTWEQAQKEILISPPNPKLCVQCHGSPARPIFQQYPRWEGAYGSRHTSKLSAAEVSGLEEFKNAASSAKSRYRHLNPKRMAVVGTGVYTSEASKITDIVGFQSADQTVKMNITLSGYNGLRVASVIRKLSFYSPLRYAIAGSFLECENMPALLTMPVYRQLRANIMARTLTSRQLQDSEKVFTKLMSDKANLGFGSFSSMESPLPFDPLYGREHSNPTVVERMSYHKQYWKNDPVMFALSVDTMSRQGAERFVPEAAMLRLIFEGHGVNIAGWWADLKQGTYRTNSGFGENWATFLEQLDPTLGTSRIDYTTKVPYEQQRKDRCEKLAKLSLVAMENYAVVPIAPASEIQPKSSYPIVFTNTCAKCHVENQIGPNIPFDNAAKMDELMQNKDFAKKLQFKVFEASELRSMPPTRLLTPQEKADIADYLKRF